jgi:hypothetical protein
MLWGGDEGVDKGEFVPPPPSSSHPFLRVPNRAMHETQIFSSVRDASNPIILTVFLMLRFDSPG